MRINGAERRNCKWHKEIQSTTNQTKSKQSRGKKKNVNKFLVLKCISSTKPQNLCNDH